LSIVKHVVNIWGIGVWVVEAHEGTFNIAQHQEAEVIDLLQCKATIMGGVTTFGDNAMATKHIDEMSCIILVSVPDGKVNNQFEVDVVSVMLPEHRGKWTWMVAICNSYFIVVSLVNVPHGYLVR